MIISPNSALDRDRLTAARQLERSVALGRAIGDCLSAGVVFGTNHREVLK